MTRPGRDVDVASPDARSAPGSHISIARLLTLPQVAEVLAVSESTIKRMVARRRMPCVRIGRQIRFLPGDVFRWLEARKEG